MTIFRGRQKCDNKLCCHLQQQQKEGEEEQQQQEEEEDDDDEEEEDAQKFDKTMCGRMLTS